MQEAYGPTFDSISEIVGFDVAVSLCLKFRGKPLYIPLVPDDSCILAQAVGLANTQKIAEVYGGMRWEVPTSLARRARIKQMRAQGMPKAAIAAALYVSPKTIDRVLGDKSRDAAQLDLFCQKEKTGPLL